MHNRTWLKICPIFVLSLGLYSCNPPDSPAPTPFRVTEPNWESKNGTSVKFARAIAEVSVRDVGDVLSFADSPVGSVRVRTRCLNDTAFSFSENTFSIPSKIQLYAMLPRELLAPSALTDPPHIRCSFDFQAANPEGSIHDFHMPEVLIRDDGWADGIKPLTNETVYHEDLFDKARFRVDSGHEALLRCDETELSTPVAANRQIVLSDFDLSTASSLRERALRRCRLLGLDAGPVRSISPPFNVSFHSAVPNIKSTPTRQTVRDLLQVKGPFQLFEFHMENINPFPLRFHLIKPTSDDFSACSGGHSITDNPNLTIEKPNDGVAVKEESGFFSIEMAPNTAINGTLVSNVAFPPTLVGKIWPTSYLFQQIKPLKLESFQIQDGAWIMNDVHDWGEDELMWYADVMNRPTNDTKISCGR